MDVMYFWGTFNPVGSPCCPRVVAGASTKPPLTSSGPGHRLANVPALQLGPAPRAWPSSKAAGAVDGAVA